MIDIHEATTLHNADGLFIQRRADGIVLSVFERYTSPNVDKWFDIVVPFYDEMEPNDRMRVLIDLHELSAVMLTYTFQMGRRFAKSSQNKAPRAYYAILYNEPIGISLFSSFLSFASRTHPFSVHYFSRAEREKAIGWLENC